MIRVTNKNSVKKEEVRKRGYFIYLWRFFCFSAFSVGVGFVFLINGFRIIGFDRVYIYGSKIIDSKLIVGSSRFILPRPLLRINPGELEEVLKTELPIRSISVMRYLFPPRLEIHIKDLKPIAYANRTINQNLEKGMVGIEGNWISLKNPINIEEPSKDILIDGWKPSHKLLISQILKNQHKLGSPLKKIFVSPSGDLSIQTEEFKMIYLGSNDVYLESQIKIISYLSDNWPSDLNGKDDKIIDIRDPLKPELQMANPTR